MNKIPGISIKFKIFATNKAGSCANSVVSASNSTRHQLKVDDWFEATLETQYDQSTSVFANSGGISVLLDGYIADVVGERNLTQFSAEDIAHLYQREGVRLLMKLRGSYSCLIVDERAGKAFLFNDRRGSRPLFCKAGNNGSMSISPEVSRLAVKSENIDNAAACEFIMFGSYYSDHTIFSKIKKLPQASLVTFSKETCKFSQYWRLKFSSTQYFYSEAALIDECHELIIQATKRVLQQDQKPFLFLSGGADSRVLLGAILTVNKSIPTAGYGTKKGDDLSIAKLLAHHQKQSFTEFSIPSAPPVSAYIDASLNSDCRAQMIDTPTMGEIYHKLSERYSLCIQGDECFGWRGVVNSRKEAFKAAGVLDISHAYRLREWLRPEELKKVSKNIKHTRSRLSSAADERDSNDFKDLLYYENRMGNMLNAYTANRLRYFEQGRPLLDEDLMEFIARLPMAMRDDKYLLRKVLQSKFPQLSHIPLASQDSIPTSHSYKSLLLHDTSFSSFVDKQLFEEIDARLASLINIDQLRIYFKSLMNGAPYQNIHSWWMNLPGMWRIAPCFHQNRVSSISMLLRILQMNIYLRHLPGS